MARHRLACDKNMLEAPNMLDADAVTRTCQMRLDGRHGA